ncbi:MFS transporter [Halococcoides cellulosivorans]|uniref:MFS transporter n=1 Tax=Halococcoides cellulosivorans TaxID=1679096 RepID=A0A2R4X4I3_9EURY|nr:MFS transporter [Halococcoides cellulosivorans]AWB28706.1 MFS transporter [Halococcoides cellulosivorans]
MATRRGPLVVILGTATLTVMAGAILGPVVPAIQSGLGVGESRAGLIVTTHGALIVLVSPLAGALVDRIGPRRPLIAGLVLYGLGGGAGLVIDAFGPLLATRAVLGVGVALVYTGLTVTIYELYDGQGMERALGLRSSANSVGAVAWPLVGGALGTVSWQAPFGVYLIALPLGALAALTIPETRGGSTGPLDPRRWHGRARSARVAGAMRARFARPIGTLSAGLRGVLATVRAALAPIVDRPALLGVYALYFGTNALLYAIVVFYPQLLDGLGIRSSFRVSLYLAAMGLAGGIAAASYDRLLVRTSRRTLVGVALATWIVAFGVATQVSGPIAAIAPVVGFGAGQGLVFPAAFGWIEALAPADRQGQLSSYLASAGYAGQFLSPVAFGLLVGPFGLRAVFAGAAGLAVLGAGVLGIDRWRAV